MAAAISYSGDGNDSVSASVHTLYMGPEGGSDGLSGESASASDNVVRLNFSIKKACDQCRKTKSKCTREVPSETCRNCIAQGITCTFLGTLKEYISALEERLLQTEALLGTLLATADGNARGLLRDIREDPLIRDFIASVDKSEDGKASLEPAEAWHKWHSLTGKSSRGHAKASSNHRSRSRADRFSVRVRCGYWNRRGDHLTPEGYIVYAPPVLAYPAELAAYPPEVEGYQNEVGARLPYAVRPVLPQSFPRNGRAPERPYESFVVYVNHNSRRSLVPLTTKIENKHEHESKNDSPSSSKRTRLDTSDLEARLAAHSSRPQKSPTSSSSSYGTPSSARSRASSWSGSPGGHITGHIPGTTRDVMEFPFGYPIPN